MGIAPGMRPSKMDKLFSEVAIFRRRVGSEASVSARATSCWRTSAADEMPASDNRIIR
ncbi:MAG: hypothetical protein ACD_75C01920G0001 [uncultured bacterium]|nr:MAG: hypothetical protein ACD_75C01920G0001 [uncultured bacterium]